ncbi:MAG: hypothetical protein E7378_01650 [Clostridiales bacterium]|nr:hypothetical protein [Clostridiales bacterium]
MKQGTKFEYYDYNNELNTIIKHLDYIKTKVGSQIINAGKVGFNEEVTEQKFGFGGFLMKIMAVKFNKSNTPSVG